MVRLATARQILSEVGWLSLQPERFRERLLQRAILLHFAPGDTLYRVGDPPGGLYGLVQGVVSASTSPYGREPRLADLWKPGHWMGEGCFLSRQPRRVGIRAITETWVLHVPLDALDQIEREDPSIVRRVSLILLINVDALIRLWHEQRVPDHVRRIAAALCRLSAAAPPTLPIPLSQAELGEVSSASRKQVNAALKQFEAEGWLKLGYRSIEVKAPGPLRRLAESED